MVGIGLSEIKQKRDENVGECRRRSEKVGVKWMFRWYVTTMENDAPSLEHESTLLMILSVATTLQHLEFRLGYRPARCLTKSINSSKGGAIAQLQTVSDCIHTQCVKKPSKEVFQDVPINKMALIGLVLV